MKKLLLNDRKQASPEFLDLRRIDPRETQVPTETFNRQRERIDSLGSTGRKFFTESDPASKGFAMGFAASASREKRGETVSFVEAKINAVAVLFSRGRLLRAPASRRYIKEPAPELGVPSILSRTLRSRISRVSPSAGPS